ncbi:MAG: imidazolonepropionase [Alphaproteobacteria bacterium]|nr:MAG: imidazolonepropionase [Alphaproteobacteria bacterium]
MSDKPWDRIWKGAGLVTCEGEGLGLIEQGLIAVRDNEIVWVGAEVDAPRDKIAATPQIVSLNGGWVFPGLIDCHTHLVFGGNRAREFEMRLEGATYEEIARAGGGILSTVKATRAASEEELFAASLPRARDLLREGVTTLEIKSGYGLDLQSEIKMLKVARAIGAELGLTIKTSCLAAHALPPEYAGRAGDYIDLICSQILPRLAEEGLADAVDGFCEGIAFSPDEIARVFETAKDLGLPVKLHADQLSDLDGAALAASFDGLSADHLEYTNPKGVEAMARAGTVAVLLPGAFYTLKETRRPPIETFRKEGVSMALASDCNPGSSPISSLRLILNMGCTLFGLTPTEALRGVTVNAAKALGESTRKGRLAVGMDADFCHYKIGAPADLCYWMSGARPDKVVMGGGEITVL